MFGHDAKPSKIYSFGCKPPREPMLRECLDQMFRAHCYRNDLVRRELDRRKAVQELLLKLCPDVARLQAAFDASEQPIKNLLEEIRQANIETGKKTGTKEQKAELKNLRATRKNLAAELKAARGEAFADAQVQADLESIEEADVAARKTLRANCNISWGSYLAVEQSMQGVRKGAPPKFHRYRGDAKLAVQLQGGLGIDALLRGKDNRLRMERSPSPRVLVHFRIGSLPGTVKPLWAEVPILLDRPMPQDAQIKWAYLLKRRIGTHDEWRMQFVLSRDAWEPCNNDPLAAKSGEVAFDLGWRKVPQGIRVATWGTRSDGWMQDPPVRLTTDYHAEKVRELPGDCGQLIIPTEELKRWEYVEGLQAVRDKEFNGALATLHAWLRGEPAPEYLTGHRQWLQSEIRGTKRQADNAEKDNRRSYYLDRVGKLQTERMDVERLQRSWIRLTDAPKWFLEATRFAGNWRKENRLASLMLHWREAEHRFAEDRLIYPVLEWWRQRDKHLYDWKTNLHIKATRWRDYVYGRFVAELRRKYRLAVVENTDWRPLIACPGVEAEKDIAAARRIRQIAAPGRLRQVIKQGFMECVTVDTAHSTHDCYHCGQRDTFDQVRVLVHTCSQCGRTWDTDANAVQWHLRRAEEERAEATAL